VSDDEDDEEFELLQVDELYDELEKLNAQYDTLAKGYRQRKKELKIQKEECDKLKKSIKTGISGGD